MAAILLAAGIFLGIVGLTAWRPGAGRPAPGCALAARRPLMLAPRTREPDSPFALGEPVRSWRDLLGDAAALARSLTVHAAHAAHTASAAPEVMVACADRYLCAVALLAVWRGGRIAALPPNGRPETIDRLCAERGIPLILHDGGGDGGVDVRSRLGEARVGGAAPEPQPSRSRAGE